MYYKAIVNSPGTERARDNLKRSSSLGRLDSGIELDLGLSSASRSKFESLEYFLTVQKGDLFKRVQIPEEKKLIYVERISRESNSSDDGGSYDGVFCLDVDGSNSNCEENTVARGYIPLDCVELDDLKLLDEGNNNEGRISCCHCMNCTCGYEEAKKQESIIKKLSEENKSLKAQLHELQLTNDGLVDSLSWNGDDEPNSSTLSIPASPRPISPRLWKSPRPLRARSRTTRSDCSDSEMDVFLKILDKPVEKKDDLLEEEILLSCTLCSRKIKLTELQIHSKICSSAAANKGLAPNLPNMLITNVTQVNEKSQMEQLLKIISKTTLKSYDGHLFEVNRSLEEFLWFREMLQLQCPSRIVPCIQLHETVGGNFREVQRFLRRLTNHQALKNHDFLRDFLTKKDFEPVKQHYEKKNLRRLPTPLRKPTSVHHDENSLLYRAFSYFTTLISNLENLANHLKERMDRKIAADDISKRFYDLSGGEVNETYLKIAASGLGRITQETSIKREDCHEATLVEEIESLIGNLKEAENLLKRIETRRDKFLYWNEQMTMYEQQNNDKDKSTSMKASVTQKWAEALANCDAAKASLENICKHLSEELQNFDFSKELDLKDLLIDFADGKFQHYEKLQSKWYGVRIMLDAQVSPSKRAFDIT